MTITTSKKTCTAVYLGVMPYERALKLQRRLVQARAEGSVPDVLLLLQHPSVFTIGRFRGEEDIIATPETLAQEEIAVFHTNRGGGITYHGLGQLIGYPILNLKENGLGVREYIWKLEAVIIKLLLGLGIQSQRVANYPGVWVGEKKVCSVGIHVSHYITMHGFALNVSNNLRYFSYINACGIKGEVMTSISKLLGHPVEVETVIGNLLDSFSEILGLKCEQGDDNWLATLDDLSG
ncbi:MAG: lipoyl(octanoyl) transferase LipB [Dehalococcoidia bacterium]|nr:MAG: lipoyl(octanoyl) transferase LipB [Dehalococcoidia bacterium]